MNQLMIKSYRVVLPVVALIFFSCSYPQEVPNNMVQRQIEEMKPGFGEIMGTIQQHHAKLYFAGNAENWKLSQYQLDEIRELLEDAVKYHPIFKKDLPVSELVPTIMNEPLNSMSAAISKKDKEVFLKAYENLTVSCNRCHTATQHEYIVIQTPTGNEFSNQKFVP